MVNLALNFEKLCSYSFFLLNQGNETSTQNPKNRDNNLTEEKLQKLDPKIRQWLSHPQYTQYSLSPSERPPLTQSQETSGIVVVVPGENHDENVEQEIIELKNLPTVQPIISSKVKNIPPLKEPILKIKDDHMLKIINSIQYKLNECSHIIAANQDQLYQKIIDLNPNLWNGMKQSSTCGSILNKFEYQISEGNYFLEYLLSFNLTYIFKVWNIKNIIDNCKNKITDVVQKTRYLYDLLPPEEKEDIHFPFILAPYLTKEYYLYINYLKDTPYYKRENFSLEKIKEEERLENVWIYEILPYWNSLNKNKRIKSLWRRGIPPRLRGFIWKKIIGNKLNLTREQYFDYLQNHFETFENEFNEDVVNENDETDKKTYSHPFFKKKTGVQYQIRMDAIRTFTKIKLFSDTKSKAYKDIVSVLSAIQYYNPERGYIQGMSYLAGMLLMYMDAADTFIYLSNLLETHFFSSLCQLEIDEVCPYETISNNVPNNLTYLSSLINIQEYTIHFKDNIFRN